MHSNPPPPEDIVLQLDPLTTAPEYRDWSRWAAKLQLWGLDRLVGWFMEAAGPLVILSAQLLYFGQPFLGQDANKLARLLESEQDSAIFAEYLASVREANHAGKGETQ
jgi:hypothetical protein